MEYIKPLVARPEILSKRFLCPVRNTDVTNITKKQPFLVKTRHCKLCNATKLSQSLDYFRKTLYNYY